MTEKTPRRHGLAVVAGDAVELVVAPQTSQTMRLTDFIDTLLDFRFRLRLRAGSRRNGGQHYGQHQTERDCAHAGNASVKYLSPGTLFQQTLGLMRFPAIARLHDDGVTAPVHLIDNRRGQPAFAHAHTGEGAYRQTDHRAVAGDDDRPPDRYAGKQCRYEKSNDRSGE